MFLYIISVFFSLPAMAQAPTEAEVTLHENLMERAEKTNGIYFSFSRKSWYYNHKVVKHYDCQVSDSCILSIVCDFACGNKSGNQGDSLFVHERVLFYKGKPLEVEHEEVPKFYKYDNNKVIEENDGAPWSIYYTCNYGKIISYYSNGHGATETDNWDHQKYYLRIYKELKAGVRRVHPEWK